MHLSVLFRPSQIKASGTVDIMDMHKDMMLMDMQLLPKTLICIMEAILDMETTSSQEPTNSHSR